MTPVETVLDPGPIIHADIPEVTVYRLIEIPVTAIVETAPIDGCNRTHAYWTLHRVSIRAYELLVD